MTDVPGLWADWFGDGFGAHAENDLTPYLRAIRYQRGGTADITGSAQPGSCTIVLSNPDGLFDPDNASGPLYGLLHDGIRVWFGANEDGTISGAGTVRGRFAGRTLTFSAIPQPGAGTSTPEVEITCEDAKGWYARTPVSLSVAAAPSDYVPPLPVLPPSIVQQTIHGPGNLTLPLAPTPGNLVVAAVLANFSPSVPTGFTGIGSPVTFGYGSGAGVYVQLSYRVVQPGDTADLGHYGSSGFTLALAEIAGVTALDSHAELASQLAAPVHVSVTPTAGTTAIVLAVFPAIDLDTGCARWGNPVYGTPLPTWDSGWTQLGGGGSPDGNIGLSNACGAVWAYQIVTSTSGTYSPGFTWGCATAWGAQAAVFKP